MSTDFVWANAVKNSSGTSFILPDRWQALHCLLHHSVSDHGYSRRILCVKALWEWTMLSRDFTRNDWEAVGTHMRNVGASDLLGSWVLQADRLFRTGVTDCVAVSPGAVSNASAIFNLATKAHWRRRIAFIVDQLRFSFARETLAMRYGKPAARVTLVDAGRHAMNLLTLHRGRWLRRLLGHPNRPS
jgi:hypothetical protein